MKNTKQKSRRKIVNISWKLERIFWEELRGEAAALLAWEEVLVRSFIHLPDHNGHDNDDDEDDDDQQDDDDDDTESEYYPGSGS